MLQKRVKAMLKEFSHNANRTNHLAISYSMFNDMLSALNRVNKEPCNCLTQDPVGNQS